MSLGFKNRGNTWAPYLLITLDFLSRRGGEKVLPSKAFTGERVFTFDKRRAFCPGEQAGELGHCFCSARAHRQLSCQRADLRTFVEAVTHEQVLRPLPPASARWVLTETRDRLSTDPAWGLRALSTPPLSCVGPCAGPAPASAPRPALRPLEPAAPRPILLSRRHRVPCGLTTRGPAALASWRSVIRSCQALSTSVSQGPLRQPQASELHIDLFQNFSRFVLTVGL